MRHILRLRQDDHHAALIGGGTLLLDAARVAVAWAQHGGSAATLTVNGRSIAVHIAGSDERRFIWIDGETYEIEVLEPLAVHARRPDSVGGLQARAPMPGNVVSVAVALGEAVLAGDVLVVIESMKLEMAVRAPQAGRVAEIRCGVGQSFDKDAVLVCLEAEAS
jgi:acetyl/propionyl-CoA carboxylase alpha subunit